MNPEDVIELFKNKQKANDSVIYINHSCSDEEIITTQNTPTPRIKFSETSPSGNEN